MKYLAVGFVSRNWPSRAIWLPWSAKDDPTFDGILKIAQELGSPIEGLSRGRILYMPLEEANDEFGGQIQTQKYLCRAATNDEVNLIHELEHLSSSSYDLYNRDDTPRFSWSNEAKIEYGRPSNPDAMIDDWSVNPNIEEFIIVTEIKLDLSIDYSIRFYLGPSSQSEALIQFLISDLGLENIQLASTKEYGFATTRDKELHRQLNKKTIKVPKIGLILFDYAMNNEEDEDSSDSDSSI